MSSFQLAGTVSGQTAFDKLVRPAALCRCEGAEHRKLEEIEETGLNGVEEGQDEMSDGGDRIDAEEKLAAPDWRVRARPRNKPTRKEREEHEATHVPFRDWCAHCMMGRGRAHDHVTNKRARISRVAPPRARNVRFDGTRSQLLHCHLREHESRDIDEFGATVGCPGCNVIKRQQNQIVAE